MSDPTTPARPSPEAPTTPDSTSADRTTKETAAASTDFTTEMPAVRASDPTEETAEQTTTAEDASGKPEQESASAPAAEKKKWWRIRLRAPWVTVGGVVVVLVVLALVGYLWGLGPLSRLNAERGINPPAKLAGLDRITDPEIRRSAQLDETQDALSRINNGKNVTVEAYGSLQGDRFFVVIALRGKVDIDKTIADSGAAPDKIKHIGRSTCVESTGNLPTQCYRGSNTLTVITQSANEGVTVDQVEPVAEEAFSAMK